ncbi:uncharacterized protein LOC124924978 [Impatiens glandulifera]|uniref:uncharacterized protein LOC124924978 n=1 Tax=Impatiens glandulifera TaxID=253017 RepID=UPI001FB1332E|nr:uncharacterized protein LOC124924978 [Impatiens glandulifera]
MSATDGRRKMVPGKAPVPTKKKGVVKETRDEELAMFAEMHKREKDRLVSLLQPVSDDSIDGYSLYHRLSTAHGNLPKGPSHSSLGYEFLAEKVDSKNDYDWLKTPPATPLFPSLETDAINGHTLVVQRELPILQPLSRFSGNYSSKTTPTKTIIDDTSLATKVKAPPRLRSVTPTPRVPTNSSSSQERNVNINTFSNSKLSIGNTQKLNKSMDNNNTNGKLKQMSNMINGTSLSKSMGEEKSLTNGSGVKPTIPTSNIRTSTRSYSTSRDRPVGSKTTTGVAIINQKTTVLGQKTGSYCDDTNNNIRKPTMKSRQSCSPSVTRGRKPAATEQAKPDNINKTNGTIGRNGTQFMGSRMVDKFMNARNMKSGRP